MTELSPEYKQVIIDRYGPVAATFKILQTPKSNMQVPPSIKRDWLGMQLPVREKNLAKLSLTDSERRDLGEFNAKNTNRSVAIVAFEAVHILEEAEKFEAAEFWAYYQDPRTSIFNTGLLTFRTYEGELESFKD
jgi:hypothetical protein